MYAINKQELRDALPITGIMWASVCCGGAFSCPPTYEGENYTNICEVCGLDCQITPAWAVNMVCQDHGQHDVPVPIQLYMQDGLN